MLDQSAVTSPPDWVVSFLKFDLLVETNGPIGKQQIAPRNKATMLKTEDQDKKETSKDKLLGWLDAVHITIPTINIPAPEISPDPMGRIPG